MEEQLIESDEKQSMELGSPSSHAKIITEHPGEREEGHRAKHQAETL